MCYLELLFCKMNSIKGFNKISLPHLFSFELVNLIESLHFKLGWYQEI
jgi:hypothetical protein